MDTPTGDLLSIGNVATQFGRSVEEVRTAIDALGVRPVMTLNGVPYYERSQLGPVAEALGSQSVASGRLAVMSQRELTAEAQRRRWQL